MSGYDKMNDQENPSTYGSTYAASDLPGKLRTGPPPANGAHQQKNVRQRVAGQKGAPMGNLTEQQALYDEDVEVTTAGGASYEFGFRSMVAWAEDESADGAEPKNWWPPLIDVCLTEFTGTTINVFMACLVFSYVYNAQPVPAGGLLSDRLSDYLLIAATIGLTAAATHAAFWSESAKWIPFLSVWTCFVPQSMINGIGYNVCRLLAELIGQIGGGGLGAYLAHLLQPITLQATYLDAGYPFYNNEVMITQNRAIFLQLLGMFLIAFVYCRVQYAATRKSHIVTPSLLLGSAYAAAALVMYATGGCTTFARWLGCAMVTGNMNILVDLDTTVDATNDGVTSPAWVYLVAEMAGTAIAVLIYITGYRPTYSSDGLKTRRA